MSKRMLLLMCSIFLIVPLLFLGCGSGDSGAVGATGPAGAAGSTGPAGEDLTANPTPEACAVCHRSVATTHAQTGVVTVNVTSSGLNGGGDFVATLNVKVDGVNSDSFAPYAVYLHFDNAAQPYPSGSVSTFTNGTSAPMITTGQRNQLFGYDRNTHVISVSIASVVSAGNGNYQVTVPAANVIDNSNLLTIVKAPSGSAAETSYIGTWELEGTANIQLGTAHLRDLVSNEGCAKCHGPAPAWSEKFKHYAVGGSECQICHSIVGRNVGIISLADNGARIESKNRAGTNAVEYFHGIHKSASMPDGKYFRSTNPSGSENSYEIGYPSEIRNCNVCHTTDTQLKAAAEAPVSYYLCMSCHQKWDGFVDHDGVELFLADDFHRGFGMDTDCMPCHAALQDKGKSDAAGFHNFFEAANRHYDSFYGGKDISAANPNGVEFFVTGVTKPDDNNVTFTWQAKRKGDFVNPCDNTQGWNFRNLAAYLAYAKGDDWVNDNVGTSPGQPASSKNLFTILSTTCASDVATTTGLKIADNTAYATKAMISLTGKAVDTDTFVIGTASVTKQYFVRVKSPTYSFMVSSGAVAANRRPIVDNDKCLKCHKGTMYQHGGDRVDNVQMCVLCHNPSAGDKNNRKDYYKIVNADNTVNRDATYDGKSNETYDLRTLLHAIHGAEKRANPLVIYRSSGVYAFAAGGAAKPAGWPADNLTVRGAQANGSKRHNWIEVHYPQPVNNCLACHIAETYEVADQTKAAPLTVEPGTSWKGQADDISIGPTAAACTACHATSVARSHAQHEGYMANVAKEYMIDMSQPEAFWVIPPSP